MPRPQSVFGLILTCLLASPAFGEHKATTLIDPVPDAIASSVRSSLESTGWLITDNDKPVLKVWLRKAIPGASKPGAPKGNVLFPFLSEGELLGAVEVLAEIGDYRDQPIEPGVYTFRYGLQPVNGDHLGTSPFRDYGCLVPAGVDTKPDALTKKVLEKQSAEAAGSSHPAIMMFLAVDGESKPGMIVQDDPNERTSVILPLNVTAEGQSFPILIQWIVAGHAPV